MNHTNGFLKRIRSAFNLNVYEAKAWLAVLSKGIATAGEISELSGIPRSRSYDILESLERRGFIIMQAGRPVKYLAVAPAEVIRRVKRSIEENADKEIAIVEGIKTDAFKDLETLYKQGVNYVNPNELISCLRGKNSIYDNLAEKIASAEQEVLIATTKSELSKEFDTIKDALRKAKQRQKKIEVKIAAPIKTKEIKELGNELSQHAKVRDINLHARFILIDGKEVIFALDDTSKKDADLGIGIKTPFFASALKTLFENAWGKK